MAKQPKPPKRRRCRTPLESLWNDHEDLPAHRQGCVTASHIQQLLATEPVSLVLACASDQLQWHSGEAAEKLWLEVKGHICNELEEGCSLQDFPGHYFFYAIEWRLSTGEAVIVLEQHH